jgi:cytoskeleton protein RodZ
VTVPPSDATTGDRFPPGATAGALLFAAREALGLSIDTVAQQLKLAPRQVRALEEGDYAHLPGRTFVRGFIRSYARLVRLDPDQVLGALTAGTAERPLEAPALQQTAPTMGELPTAEHSKAGWMRWAIPLTLAAVVAAAAVYEWLRPSDTTHPAAATAPENSAIPAAGDKSVISLPNPVAAGAPAAQPRPQVAPTSAVEPSPTGSAPVSVPAAGIVVAPASGASEPAAIAAAPPAPSTAAPAAAETIGITFRDYSWTEIRDRSGRVILSGMNRGGTTQSVSGTPPLDIVIGNAVDVRVTFRGSAVDLAPHTRQNVARFKLP